MSALTYKTPQSDLSCMMARRAKTGNFIVRGNASKKPKNISSFRLTSVSILATVAIVSITALRYIAMFVSYFTW